jgi:two-component sensor histidine kinase
VLLRPRCGKRLQIASQVGLDDNPRVTQEPRVDEVDLEGFQGDTPIITKSKHLLPFEPSGDGSEATDLAAVYLPLRVEDRLIGAIGLYFEGDPGQSGEDLKLLGALGEYATAAADRQDKSNELEISRKRVFQNQEAVKKQVSGSLHGPVQTRLLVVWHRLGQLEAEMEDRSGAESSAHARIGEFRAELMGLQEYVRMLSSQLYPAIVKVGLVPALRSLCDRFDNIIAIDVSADAALEDRDKAAVSEEQRLILYRVTEEALTNVVKHGNATHAMVRGWVSDGQVNLSIQDDGDGFVVDEVTDGLGFAMMRDYADAAGGSIRLESAVGEGTTVYLTLQDYHL